MILAWNYSALSWNLSKRNWIKFKYLTVENDFDYCNPVSKKGKI